MQSITVAPWYQQGEFGSGGGAQNLVAGECLTKSLRLVCCVGKEKVTVRPMRLEVMGDEQDLLEELPVRVDAIRVFERMIFGSQRTQWTKICFACGSPSF